MFSKLKNRFDRYMEDRCQFKGWNQDGFLILKNFFDKYELRAFDHEINDIFSNRDRRAGDITIDVLEGDLAGQRLKLKTAPDTAIQSAHKVNDLYLESKACRNLNLNTTLCGILKKLLKDNPLVINSLSFRKGSQQPLHFDTYYMPPPIENKMVVSSICIEDQCSETGPVSYYPGSHKIKPYVFSHGGIHAVSDEMEKATEYVEAEIKRRGLVQETFVGNAGDVLIWHAQLYHGGLPITDHTRTRKTLVTHYWRKHDVDKERVATIDTGGDYLMREHQHA